MPSDTMSAPSSGSTTASSTAITSSRLGGGVAMSAFYRSAPCNLTPVTGSAAAPFSGASLPSRDVLRVLGDNTRYAIYLELARAPRPLVTAEIAETLGLHPNTVRPHLERMREVGLLEVTTDARGEVGRPQHRYSLAPDAPALGLEPPTMPMLARMVLAMARRLGANPADAVAVGEAEGAARAARYAQAPSALEALVADLDRLGFDPVVSGDDTDGGPDEPVTAVVAFANCPFADLARAHPDLVCALHRGLVTGFVARMGDAEVTEFCPLAHRTPCRVAVTSR
jgi:predicted ArsR family transcriptional regulator